MKKNIFFAIITFIVIFLLFELLVNFAKIRPLNSNYGWSNAHDKYSKYINRIEVNEYGNRDLPKAKRFKNKNNIILLGDSQIELSQESQNMPARILENKLNRNFNVYSIGSWGWGNDQQLLFLKNNINQIKPKYVILFFTSNDLENNLNHIGFKGEKPTYKINNSFEIQEPKFLFLKSVLNNFWTYRSLYRLNLLREKKKYKNYLEDESFFTRDNCSNKDTIDSKGLFNYYSNYDYLRKKHIETSKKRGEEIVNENDFKKNLQANLITRNRYKVKDDRLYYFRDIHSVEDKKQIFLTNYLIKNIQEIASNNNAKFILLNVVNENYLFKDDKIYNVCVNNKLVKYSNIYFYSLFRKVFDGIDNIVNYKIDRGIEEYDLIDGHLKFELNQKIFEIIANKIKNFEKEK